MKGFSIFVVVALTIALIVFVATFSRNDNSVAQPKPTTQIIQATADPSLLDSYYQNGYQKGVADANSAHSNDYNSGYSAGQQAANTDSYNSGYNAGYNVGYSAGQQATSTNSYNSGYNAGYSDGLNNRAMSTAQPVLYAPATTPDPRYYQPTTVESTAVPASAKAPKPSYSGGSNGYPKVAIVPAETLTLIQNRLRELGFYKLASTGQWNTETVRAIMDFQKEKGLYVDGCIGPTTTEKLGLSDRLVVNDKTVYRWEYDLHDTSTPTGYFGHVSAKSCVVEAYLYNITGLLRRYAFRANIGSVGRANGTYAPTARGVYYVTAHYEAMRDTSGKIHRHCLELTREGTSDRCYIWSVANGSSVPSSNNQLTKDGNIELSPSDAMNLFDALADGSPVVIDDRRVDL